ncbi:copper resistance protein CopC [Miltoncostaea marina]|uniref:copper resistance protein CopC n=1 Tax=Miltoncostaea marina TaxID=2843215 RepID=UPI001C3C55C1|nr:copper resistance protein CopC [Miltoncostaea marina]
MARSASARSSASAALCAVVLALVVAAPAAAHTALETVRPADGAVLAEVPPRVVAAYGTALAAAGPAQASGGGGARVAGAARLDPRDARRLIIPLAGGGPGLHTVTWTVTGADGHDLTGRTTFRVRAPSLAATLRRVARELRTAAAALERAAAAATAR